MNLNRDAEHCQPCDNFTSPEHEQGMMGPTPHECFAPFGDDTAPWCGGHVYFCGNCNRDHHAGGYNTCKAVSPHCDHPVCVARRNDWTRRNNQ